jgi:hypothetical protein
MVQKRNIIMEKEVLRALDDRFLIVPNGPDGPDKTGEGL